MQIFFSNVSFVLLLVEPMAVRLSTLSTAKPLNAGSLGEGGYVSAVTLQIRKCWDEQEACYGVKMSGVRKV